MVRVRGETSNGTKAATAARAFARPRGGVERSETAVSDIMVRVRGETSNGTKAATAARAFARPRGGVERSETAVSDIVVQFEGQTSNGTKAATAARAFARPRGGVERSETAVSEIMVRVRGEPSNQTTQVGLAGGNLQTKNPKLKILVRPRGLEPPRAFAHNDLNVARLPVPPRPHSAQVVTKFLIFRKLK